MKLFIIIFLIVCGIYPEDRKFQFLEPVVLDSDAFTMIGDSRAQYIFQIGQNVDWEDNDFLGKFKSGCSENKIGIQNAGIAGSTTEHWLGFLKSEAYKPKNFHERIVLMIGGNDIQRNAYRWKGFRINKEEELKKAIDEIHSRVVEIVNILRESNKKVIIQTHFRVNPAKNTAHNKALNEGLDELNLRLWKTFGNKTEILESDTSLSFINPDFPSLFFLDLVHLNPFGYQMHSYYLSKELRRRCWW